MKARDSEGADLHDFKREVYDYLQSKLKQLTKSYSPRLAQLSKQVEATELKLREMNDLNNDSGFQFEEFKDQIAVKHKLLLDSVQNGHQTIVQLDSRLKDYYSFMLNIQKQVGEVYQREASNAHLDAHNQQLSSLEQRLGSLALSIEETVKAKVTEARSQEKTDAQQSLDAKIAAIEK